MKIPDDREFLNQICADPFDDDIRLIYCDWLQEHGREDQAEFIRLQISLHGQEYYEIPVRDREVELFRKLYVKAELLLSPYGHLSREIITGDSFDRCRFRIYYQRGFPYCISCMHQEFIHQTHAEVLFQNWPITKVVLHDRKPYDEDSLFSWSSRNPEAGPYEYQGDRDEIDFDIFKLMRGKLFDLSLPQWNWKEYKTLDKANEELSAACMRYARTKAGLGRL